MPKRLLILTILFVCCSPDYDTEVIIPVESEDATYELRVSALEGGTVNLTGGTFNAGESITITATAEAGYVFTNWSNGSVDNPLNLIVTSDQTITANFEAIGKKVYIPESIRNEMDVNNPESNWYYGRSKESDNIIIFWESEFGMDPNSEEVPAHMRVDIDFLLSKAEEFYQKNIELGFVKLGAGESYLDQYKLMIMLLYDEGWAAYGSGYDDIIGAIWISPSTCQPCGQTVAHEIGHAFQYQVHCDLGGDSGYRYGFGPNGSGGNGFWEQTAQYQAFKSYPNQVFDPIHAYNQLANKTFMHEDLRYLSYWIHYYWEEKHGIDFMGKLWRESKNPEDPVQAYMRINNITLDQFHAEFFEAVSKFATWDIHPLRELGQNYIDINQVNLTHIEEATYKISKEDVPGTAGYNIIKLNVPDAGTVVSTEFTGLLNDTEFNPIEHASDASWRMGYVAQRNNGERIYGEMNQANEDIPTHTEFTIPDATAKLWFVVTGAPEKYRPHPWLDPPHPEEQWPYTIKFINTNKFGACHFEENEFPNNIDFSFDLRFPVNDENYTGTTVTLNSSQLYQIRQAFKLCSDEFKTLFGNKIQFGAEQADGTISFDYTANGYGHWFDSNGNVLGWSDEHSRIASEYDDSDNIFTIVQYPGKVQSGESYTIKQVFLYRYSQNLEYKASFTFNIIID
ncbi:MAG: DUF6055 domain-containing protein [Flavobacteriaceae bacterium]